MRSYNFEITKQLSKQFVRIGSAFSNSFSALSLGVSYTWHAPETYRQILETLRFLKHQKLSVNFHDFQAQILSTIRAGQIVFNGDGFKLNGQFIDFFNPQNLNQTNQIEPKEIVRIKNILDFLSKLEELFLEIENLSIQDLNPEKFTHRIKTLVPVIWSFRSVKNKAHVIFEKLIELNDELELLFTFEESLISNLLLKSLNIFFIVHESALGEVPELQNVSDIIASESQKIKGSIAEKDWSAEIGRLLGMGVYMMAPYNPTQSPFWSQAISKVPLALTTLTEKITLFSQNFEGHQQTKSSIALLKKRIDRVLKDLEYFNTSDVLFALKLIPILFNLNSIFEVFKLFVSHLGHVQKGLQDLVKEKIRLLKFELLLNVGVFLDELEVELFLQPGQLSEKFFLKIEPAYAELIDFLSNYVELEDVEDEDILRLCDAQWSQERLDASYLRKAKQFLHIQCAFLGQEQLDGLPFINDVFQYKAIFGFLAPYFKQISPQIYNDILGKLQVGEIPILNEQVIIRINNLFRQYFQSARFVESRMNQSHLYLDDLQTKMGVFLELEEQPSESQLRYRLGAAPALIRLDNKFFFYDGFNPQNPLKPLERFPVELNPLPKNALRYLDTHELNSLLLTVGHTLSRPLALKSLRVTHSNEWHHSIDINESFVLNPKHQHSKQIEDISALTSAELLMLLCAYKRFLFKVDVIKNNLNQFCNTIKAIYCPSPDAILDMDRKNALALSLTKIGIYLGAQQIRELAVILGQYKVINIQELQSWASKHHLPVLVSISAIKEKNLLRYQELNLEYKRKTSLEFAQKFEELTLLPRAEYFLSSTVRSTYLVNLELKVRQLLDFFSPEFKDFLVCSAQGGFESLLEFDKYLEQPQQVLLFKWLLNSIIASRQFFERIESLKKADFTNGVYELGAKIDLVQSFLNAWQYLYQGTSLAYHQNMFSDFGRLISNLGLGIFNKFDYFQISNHAIEELSPIDKAIHWFLNGSEILEYLASSREERDVLKQKLETSSVITIQKIRKITAISDSYLKLFINTSTIYHLLTVFKTQLAKLPKTVYDINYKKLLHLRAIFFADVLLAVEKLELDLGFQSKYISVPFVKILNIIFEHYLIALNLDLSIFCKVILDDSLENRQQEYYKAQLANAVIEQAPMHSNYLLFLEFIQLFETNHKRFRYLADSSPEIQGLKNMLKDTIAPILDMLQHLNNGQTAPELRSEETIFWDQKFNNWIAETSLNFNTTSYTNFFKNCKSYYQGQLTTLELRQQRLMSKYTELQAAMTANKVDTNKKLKKYLETYYDQFVSQFIAKSCLNLKYLATDCHIDITQHFHFRRDGNIKSLERILFLEYQKPLNSVCDKFVGDGVMNQAMNEVCKHEISEPILECYYALEKVLETITLFEAYIKFTEEKLKYTKTDNFEDANSLAAKKAGIEHLKGIILDKKLSIKQRAEQAQAIIQAPNFKEIMLDKCHSHGNWLQKFLWACYQGFLEFLAYLKLYDLKYAHIKKIVHTLQHPPKVPKDCLGMLSKHHFFDNLNAPIESTPISLGLA